MARRDSQTAVTSFVEWVFDKNKHLADKTALVDDNQQLTYGDLERHVSGFSSYLKKLKIQPQQRILICMDDCVEWPVAFLSCLAVGANPVLVSSELPTVSLNKIIKLTDAVAVISNKIIEAEVDLITNILNHTSQTIDFYQYHPDEPCVWLLSSGTTGDSKCIVHRHSALYNLFQIATDSVCKIDQDSRIYSTAKLSFTYGFNNAITFGLGSGATVYLLAGAPAPTRVFEKLQNHQITHFFTVPTIINSMVKHGQHQQLPSSITMMVSAGEPLPLSLCQQFEHRYNIKIYNCIGMGETMQMYCSQSKDHYESGTIGVPLPGVECKILNDLGEEVVDGSVGELWVKTPCAALMYWKNWSSTKEIFQGPWVKTGDQVMQTPTGHYVYVSRSDELIKINGLFVSPIEIESAILECENVVDCAVISSKSKNELPEIHAFIVGDVDVQMVRDFLKNHLPGYKIPKYIKLLDNLPKTITNKKQRAVLRQTLNDT